MIPLFGPVPGGMEVGVIALVLAIILAPAYHVYRDAKARGSDYVYPWTMGMFIGGVIGNIFGILLVGGLYYAVEVRAV
ncbi:hypothetical protein SAMN05421858_1219 [Haladaptatus litoreus]|uniref:Uncharacterized protein n=1 Tax=Haladaptatus litoreus TaxID=553468 RepID=A0A1N6XPV5_9EURY|nr:hypothetical protein [Haladaptatus litoreus]SIR04259.1 hypothetical protein SAMN05421858_1219 [Haladaptatus litoreus]